MKRTILLAVIISGLAVGSLAKLPPRGYISLYADGSRVYNSYCQVYPGSSIAKIEMWVWCLPGENGLWGAEFAIGYPANVVLDRVVYNSSLTVILGTMLAGTSTRFDACQWDWSWIAHQTLYVNSVQETYLEVIPHPVRGVFQFFNCGVGNPAEPCLKGTTLYLNAQTSPCLPPETAIGTGGSTWGAVKSLYSDGAGAPIIN
jgi:hypothetical protein